jgi:glycerol-3-phosphate cytidylyltransferase-like family protein
MFKTADKLQKYAYRIAGAENTIWSQHTNSAYFNFNGTSIRISDHLPTTGGINGSGITLSLISTPTEGVYVLQRHETGRLSVVTYKQAKEIIRSITYVSGVFKYPQTPFKLEMESYKKDNILGVPVSSFTDKQLKKVKLIARNAEIARTQKVSQLMKAEVKGEQLKAKQASIEKKVAE